MISTTDAQKIEGMVASILRHSGLDLTYQLHRDPDRAAPAEITVCFDGPDQRYLLARNAELLLAFEHLAARTLRLTPEQHEQISFDANGFKAARTRTLNRLAEDAVAQVRLTGEPFHFRPMNSRERRLLHLALAPSGLQSLSQGEGIERHLVLHPA